MIYALFISSMNSLNGIVLVCKPLYHVKVQFPQRGFGFESITHVYVFGLGLEYSRYRTLFVILVPSRDGPPYQVNGLSKLHFSNREML